MKLLTVLLMIAMLFPSCGGSRDSQSPLQRFDELSGQIRAVTADSSRVTTDVQRLSREMQMAHTTQEQAAAVSLKRDAGILARRSGSIGNTIHSLAVVATGTAAHTYLSMGVWTMTWDWFEGRQLMHVADIAWHDPLLIRGTDAARLVYLSHVASWYADMAVLSARRAAWWRWRYRRQLQYVPVNVPTTAAALAGG